MFTQAEENYLKAILSISLREAGKISTNEIAKEILYHLNEHIYTHENLNIPQIYSTLLQIEHV